MKGQLFQLIALMSSLMLLVSGCAAPSTPAPEQEVDTSVPEAPANTVPPEPEPEPVPEAPTATEEPQEEVIREEPDKTEVQKAEESIANAVADGQYVESVQYSSPGGSESFDLTIDIEDDVVTGIELTAVKGSQAGDRYMERVAAELPGLVEGKKITELDLPEKISNSSLTAAAVKERLDQLPELY